MEAARKPAGRSSSQLSSSPRHHRRSTSTDHPSIKPLPGADASLHRRPWPSSISSASAKGGTGAGTLADHLGSDRMNDLLERLNGSNMLSSEGDEENSRENLRYGGSMRYTTGKSRSSKSPLSSSSSMASAALPASPLALTAGRFSTDKNRTLPRRNKSDSRIDIPSWESDGSDSTVTARRSTGSSPRLPSPMATQMRRSCSSGLPSEACKKKQVQVSPGPWTSSSGKVRGKGGKVGGLISLGLDLFKRKPSASPPTMPSVAGGEAGKDVAHQLRMCNNRALQWRYVNARSDRSNGAKLIRMEEMLSGAWARLSMVQSAVVQKRVQLEKGKLEFRLSTVLNAQHMRLLEGWRKMERRHSLALSATADHLQAAVCKVPLVEGAKANVELTSVALRRAMDLMTTIRAMTSFFSPMSQNMAPLLSELAEVAVRERSLIEECFELLGLLSTLQVREWSLKCHIIQLKSLDFRQVEQVIL